MGFSSIFKSRRASRKPLDFNEMAASEQERRAWLDKERSGLEQIFQEHDGRILHKWVHYLGIYDRYFDRFRGSDVRMIEIGVSQGGSLEMWRKYFGPDAAIMGVDINEESASCVDHPNRVSIGSQADGVFLRKIVDDFGHPDIILDDGSHIAAHQLASFQTLFPLLKNGGIYVIEDVHTAYWPYFGGGYAQPGTAIELAKQLIDDMHHWYHDRDIVHTTDVPAIHVYDSMVIFEKNVVAKPMHLHVGKHAPADGSPPPNRDLFPPRSLEN